MNKTKIALWFLGSLGVINFIFDIWFRLAIIKETGSSFWVLAAVIATIIIFIITLLSTMYLKRKK